MAAKKRSTLHPGIRKQLEDALLEALHRHVGSRAARVSAKKKKVPIRKKTAGKKKAAKKRPARRKQRA